MIRTIDIRELKTTLADHQSKEAKHCYKPVINRFMYQVYTIWLFTFSDLKTIIVPSTAFALLNTLAISTYDASVTPKNEASSQYPAFWIRIPRTLLWTWINLLPFAINNQRQPAAVEEDRLNKPWRPMPTDRISTRSAKRLMIFTYSLAVLVSISFGNCTQCFTLIALGYWYNDGRGADKNWAIRNLINAGGFVCFYRVHCKLWLQRNNPHFRCSDGGTGSLPASFSVRYRLKICTIKLAMR
jgi:hypothetical protein